VETIVAADEPQPQQMRCRRRKVRNRGKTGSSRSQRELLLSAVNRPWHPPILRLRWDPKPSLISRWKTTV